jgi:NADPH:quinone reductase-like Zn-dependent oxidoreductase
MDLDIPPLKENQILVQVEASAIDGIDFDFFKGNLPNICCPEKTHAHEPCPLGVQGTGKVIGHGLDMEARNLLGKRVVGMSNCMGWFSDYNIVNVHEVMVIEDSMNIPKEDCALMISNPVTAEMFLRMSKYHGLHGIANTGANSIIGRMVYSLFKSNNIPVLNIVTNKTKGEELKKENFENVLVYGDPDFEQNFRDLTEKLNIRLFFDCVGGDLLSKIIDLSPPNSRIVPYGLLSGNRKVTIDMGSLFMKKKLEPTSVLDYLPSLNKHEREQIFKEIIKNHDTLFKPHVFKTLDLKNIEEAFKTYEENRKSENSVDGKIILKCVS